MYPFQLWDPLSEQLRHRSLGSMPFRPLGFNLYGSDLYYGLSTYQGISSLSVMAEQDF